MSGHRQVHLIFQKFNLILWLHLKNAEEWDGGELSLSGHSGFTIIPSSMVPGVLEMLAEASGCSGLVSV